MISFTSSPYICWLVSNITTWWWMISITQVCLVLSKVMGKVNFLFQFGNSSIPTYICSFLGFSWNLAFSQPSLGTVQNYAILSGEGGRSSRDKIRFQGGSGVHQKIRLFEAKTQITRAKVHNKGIIKCLHISINIMCRILLKHYVIIKGGGGEVIKRLHWIAGGKGEVYWIKKDYVIF